MARGGPHRLLEFVHDRTGVSGVEFALLLPLLLLLLAATVDLGHALTVSRKLDEIASTVGDLIAQQTTWTSSDASKILVGASFILSPYESDDLTIVVAVEDIDTSGNATVNWSTAYNTASLASKSASPIAVPAKIQEIGVQVILTRVQYKLTTPVSSLFAYFTGTDGYTFDRHFFNRPRTADDIEYE